MLTPEEEFSRLEDRAIDLMEEYKDLDEFYDDEREYMERKAYKEEYAKRSSPK